MSRLLIIVVEFLLSVITMSSAASSTSRCPDFEALAASSPQATTLKGTLRQVIQDSYPVPAVTLIIETESSGERITVHGSKDVMSSVSNRGLLGSLVSLTGTPNPQSCSIQLESLSDLQVIKPWKSAPVAPEIAVP